MEAPDPPADPRQDDLQEGEDRNDDRDDPRRLVRQPGEQRTTGFLKKFYGWYLGRGRFPRAFRQELVTTPTLDEVELRLLAAAPGAAEVLEGLEAELPEVDEVLLDSMPISIYGGG